MNPVTIGAATLYHGDSYALLPQIAADISPADAAIVADPAYEFDTSGGGIFRKSRRCMDEIAAKGLDQGFDVRVLDTGEGLVASGCVLFCHNDQLPALLPALKQRYARVVLCGWAKSNPMPVANKNYAPDFEVYLHCWNAGAHPVGDLKAKRRIWTGPVGRNEFGHPTQKPLDLMRKIIANVSAPGREGAPGNSIKIIIDPFMGTGTTGIAALEAGKRFIGIEQNTDYFAIAEKRLQDSVKWRSVDGSIKAPGADEPAFMGTQEGML